MTDRIRRDKDESVARDAERDRDVEAPRTARPSASRPRIFGAGIREGTRTSPMAA